VNTKYWIAYLRRRAFPALERAGLHLTPVGYSQPIPNTADLTDAIWQRRSELVGIDLRESQQLALVAELGEAFSAECAELPRAPQPDGQSFFFGNGWFDGFDAELLYGLIRRFKPARVIEIGSGYSTLIASQAARANAIDGHSTQITAIEPNPREFLVELAGDRWQLTKSRVEDVPLSVFDELTSNDILFIDSSHVVRIGGDVVYEFLELIPRLAPGVIVHVHDIFLPFEYPQDWVMRRRRFWTEQYLLQALLTGNSEFEVLAANHLLHRDHPELLKRLFSSYAPSGQAPASFWMRRVHPGDARAAT
jgi:hypothetical protein